MFLLVSGVPKDIGGQEPVRFVVPKQYHQIYVYIYIYIYIYTYIYISTYTQTAYTHIHIYGHTQIHTHTNTHTHIYIYRYFEKNIHRIFWGCLLLPVWNAVGNVG